MPQSRGRGDPAQRLGATAGRTSRVPGATVPCLCAQGMPRCPDGGRCCRPWCARKVAGGWGEEGGSSGVSSGCGAPVVLEGGGVQRVHQGARVGPEGEGHEQGRGEAVQDHLGRGKRHRATVQDSSSSSSLFQEAPFHLADAVQDGRPYKAGLAAIRKVGSAKQDRGQQRRRPSRTEAQASTMRPLTGLRRRVRQTSPGPAKHMSPARRRSCCRACACLRLAMASPKEVTALRGISKDVGRARKQTGLGVGPGGKQSPFGQSRPLGVSQRTTHWASKPRSHSHSHSQSFLPDQKAVPFRPTRTTFTIRQRAVLQLPSLMCGSLDFETSTLSSSPSPFAPSPSHHLLHEGCRHANIHRRVRPRFPRSLSPALRASTGKAISRGRFRRRPHSLLPLPVPFP